jgi:2-keto-4-pentenoate hydratase
MNDSFDIDLAVATLKSAWASGTQIDALPETARPRTLAEGYDIQDRFVAQIDTAFAGWKLGVGSHKGKAASGIGRSIAGRVLRSCVVESGASVLLPNDAPVTIEIEIAFVLKRDVLPLETITDPMSVVGETRLTAELVRSRFTDRRAVGWPSFAADNSGFHALVVGPVIDVTDLDNFRAGLVVTVGGNERVRAASGDDVTDPIQALADLILHARERQIALQKGSIVSTGSQSAPFDTGADEIIAAQYGEISFAFVTRLGSRCGGD